MNQIPTAEEWLLSKGLSIYHSKDVRLTMEAMLELNKLHVQAALQAAYDNSEFKELQDSDTNDELKCYIENDMGDVYILDKNSILNAYDLNQIK